MATPTQRAAEIKRLFAAGDRSYAAGAKKILAWQAADPKVSLRDIAGRIGRSHGWVNDVVRWYKGGMSGSPFSDPDRHRGQALSSPPPAWRGSSGGGSSQQARSQPARNDYQEEPDEDEGPPGATDAEISEQGYLNRAADALRLAEYEDERSGTRLPKKSHLRIAKVARQAAAAWTKVATTHERKSK